MLIFWGSLFAMTADSRLSTAAFSTSYLPPSMPVRRYVGSVPVHNPRLSYLRPIMTQPDETFHDEGDEVIDEIRRSGTASPSSSAMTPRAWWPTTWRGRSSSGIACYAQSPPP